MAENKEKDLMNTNDSTLMSIFDKNRFDDLLNHMNAFIDRAWSDTNLTGSAFYALQPKKSSLPKINMSETATAYEVEIAVSGFNKEDLSLEFKDSCLFIKAEKAEAVETDEKKWLVREISSRSTRRTIHFPVEIDSSGIKCSYDSDNALIKCVLPKLGKIEPEVVKIDIE